MALSPLAYPLSLTLKDNLEDWLDTLPVITPENTPEALFRTYHCCSSSVHPSDTNLELLENNVLVLPCGCRWRRECIFEALSPDEDDDDQCILCGFQIFEKWSLESLDNWMKGLESTSLKMLEECGKDTECGICQQSYQDPEAPHQLTHNNPEAPVLLPCDHSFGYDCLQIWLSPFPNGGNGNTCPTCRRRLFTPWPTENNEMYEDLPSISDSNDDETEDMEGIVAQVSRFRDMTEREVQICRDQEREFWLHYIETHSRVFELSYTDAAADLNWMLSMIEGNDEFYFDWVGQRVREREQRRDDIREALFDRDVDREQRRRDRFNQIVSSGLEAGID